MNARSQPLSIFVLLLQIFAIVRLSAAQLDRPAYIEVASQAGFRLGVTDLYGSTNTTTDTKLCFTIRVLGQPTRAWVSTDPRYVCIAELFGTNGGAVSKTLTGRRLGSRFFDFDNRPDKKGIQFMTMAVTKPGDPPELLPLLCPDDIFDIKSPGDYILRLQLQAVVFPRTGTNSVRTNVLIRFPPLDFPVRKLR